MLGTDISQGSENIKNKNKIKDEEKVLAMDIGDLIIPIFFSILSNA